MSNAGPNIKTPDWKEDGKLFRDVALTSVSLSSLQDLLDSQANTASCLQLAYLSTCSITEVQNGIHDAAIQLESADADATVIMAHSAATAAAIMNKLPDAFELLKNPVTIPFAQLLLCEMAKDAEWMQERFKKVAAEYMTCSSILSNSFNNGNVARAELEKKIEEAEEAAKSAQVYVEQYQKAADAYVEQLTALKQEQENLDHKMDDLIHKKFALQLTQTLLGGFANLMSSGLGQHTTDSSDRSSSSPHSNPPAVNLDEHIELLAKAKTKVDELENKLSKMGDAPDEIRNEVMKELDAWKESARKEEIAMNDALHAIKDASGSEQSGVYSDLASNIVARAKIVQERQRNSEARRENAKAEAIRFQAQLTALARQAEFDAPHLEQIKMALEHLANASTNVQALAIFWQCVHTVLGTLASKSQEIERSNYLAALKNLSADDFASVVNLSVAPGLTEIYGYWWAVMDICNAYTAAASNIIDPAVGKSMYKWTSAAPGSDDMKALLSDADKKAKAGKPIMDPPVMVPVGLISTAA